MLLAQAFGISIERAKRLERELNGMPLRGVRNIELKVDSLAPRTG